MTAPIDLARLSAILARLGFDGDGGEALVLASRRPMGVLWASAAALSRLGAADIAGLTRDLFDKDGTSAFAARLSRLPAGGAYRLERLPLPGLPSPVVVACHPVADSALPLVLLHLRGSGLMASSATPPMAVPVQAPFDVAAADAAIPRPITRVLWETDAAGVLTRIDAEARCLGAEAPRLGDDLPRSLHPIAPELADRIGAAARDRGSVGLLRFAWPFDGAGKALAVEAGCTAKRGEPGGLRGFFTVHGTAAEPASVETPEDGSEQPVNDPVDTEEVIASISPMEPTPTTAEAKPPAQEPEPPEQQPLGQEPEPAQAPPGVAAPIPTGNVVHFPVMRLGPVPANFVAALRPAQPAPAGSDLGDLAAPQWAETPRTIKAPTEDAGGLSASERDAFEHIRQVLGTRPFAPLAAPAVPSAGQAPAAGLPPRTDLPSGTDLPSATELPPGLSQLLDRIPAGLWLDLAGVTYANATLRDRLGPEAAAILSGRTDLNGLTARDGTPLPAEVVSFDMAGAPAALTIVPARSSEAPAPSSADTLDLVADGHLRLNEAGLILEISSRAVRLLGLTAGEALGRPFTSLLGEGQAPGWQALAAAATSPEAQPQGPVPLRLRTAAGQPVAVQARVGRSGGALLCAFALDRPTTAPANDTAEAARREAERTSALKSEFLAKVSHEIRTPLNAILGFTEVIRDERLGPVGNARYLEYLRDIHASGTHVMSLVNDLLDLSRIEAGRMDLNLEAVDANAIVQACVNTLQTLAHRERVIVRLSLTPRLPPTLADERSLRQIVLNLLSNAVKFNEPGGQVIVSTALAGSDAVAIRIRDTGIGMSEDEIAAAMEPFRQLSTINRTGSGLGLPLTKALVEANCASMTIKSTRGEGTLVEVRFPLVEQGSVSLPAE